MAKRRYDHIEGTPTIKNWPKLLGYLLAIGLTALVGWFLAERVAKYDWQAVIDAVFAISLRDVTMAVALTVLHYLVMIAYDIVSVGVLDLTLSRRRIALVSFVGRVAGSNFGSLVAGTPLRYRLFHAWGLTLRQMLEVIVITTATFWIGFAIFSGLVFVIAPIEIPAKLQLPWLQLRPLGIGLLIAVALYFYATSRPLVRENFFRLGFVLPPARIAAIQFALSSIDVMISAAVLYTLLPDSVEASYFSVVAIYVLAAVVSLISRVPGGIGVFESAVVFALNPSEPEATLAALLAFRGIHYLLPLIPVAALMIAHEVWLHYRRFAHRDVVATETVPQASESPREATLPEGTER